MPSRATTLCAVTSLLGMLAAVPLPVRAQEPAPAARTTVIMLGTGTPAADPDRFGSAVVVLVDSTPYLFDAGVGVVRRWSAALQNGVAPIGVSSLRRAFVTHLHSDHTLGYPELIFSSWTLEPAPHRPLEVYGPKGIRAMTDHLLAAYVEDVAIRTGPGGEKEGSAGPIVHVHEIVAGVVYRDSLVTVTAFPADHGSWPQSFGYRIRTPDRDIVLSGDAGPSSMAVEQCRKCDFLIHEGGTFLAADATAYFRRFHTTVEQLAAIARTSRPKLLILYHQHPAGPMANRSYAALRSLYDGPFVVARDLDVYR